MVDRFRLATRLFTRCETSSNVKGLKGFNDFSTSEKELTVKKTGTLPILLLDERAWQGYCLVSH